ncbi:MAG: rod shape-determining protein RodA [Bacteroidia bacterium]|nr:rod shape-determining protein RodA [Bacteroidia bacterium]
MKRKINILKSTDWLIVSFYVVLVILGWINIYAAVYNEQYSSIFDFSQRYGKQLVWIGAAFIIALTIFLVDSNFFSFFTWPIYGTMLVFLISVLIFGKETNGQRAWFEIGSFRLQPSEFMKFATNLALAKFLSSYNFKIQNLRSLIGIGLIIFLPCGLILLQNDTGSALVYLSFVFLLYREGLTPYVLFFALMTIILFLIAMLVEKLLIIEILLVVAPIAFFLLNPKIKLVGIGIGIFAIAASIFYGVNAALHYKYSMYYVFFAALFLSAIIILIIANKKKIAFATMIMIFLISSVSFTFAVNYIFTDVLGKHQQDRINELLGITSDPLGTGYNVNQSKIAIGSGGFAGKGFLQGTQTKFNFVPEQSTDFIFCTVGEERGFLGTVIVISLFTILLLRLVFLAERQRSSFSRIYGYGVASILFFHIVVNIGMTIGLAPVIGIPLPFFSYGGSSLWSFTILLFIFIKLDSNRFENLA